MFFKSLTREQIVLWMGKNLKWLSGILAVLVLIGVSGLIWSWLIKEREYKAQAALYKAQRPLKALAKEESGKSPVSFLMKEDKELVLTKDMEQKANLYEQAVKQNQKLQTTVSFAIDLADFYYRYGQKEKAKELLSLFALPLEQSSVYHLAVFQLANYYMGGKDCAKALSLFSQLLSNKKANAFHLESRLQKALCMESLGRYKEALEEYEKINIENPENYMGRLAQDYKQLLILKRKLKK